MQHIPDFLDYCEIEKGLSNKTQENYQRYLETFKKWLRDEKKEDLLPHQLTAEEVWNYRLFLARKYKTRDNQNLSRKTQNYYLVSLRALLDYFADRDINSLPSTKIKLPKGTDKDSVKFLTGEQVEKLLSMPDTNTRAGLRDRAIMEVLFSTGMRIAELVNLDREQINLRQVENTLELNITGKGERPRTVFFSPRALKWMKEYDNTRTDMEKPLFINYRSKNKDKRLSPRYIQNAINRYAKMAALPVNVTPHVLRHTFATDLLSKGADLRTVQEFLGHKNIATTQVYTHVTNKRLKEIHKKLHGENGEE